MTDTLKWILIASISAVALSAGVNAVGLDWEYLRASILSMVETVGVLLLLFTGSAAAIEIAKYYRNQNQILTGEKSPQRESDRANSDVRLLVEQALEDILAQRQVSADQDSRLTQ